MVDLKKAEALAEKVVNLFAKEKASYGEAEEALRIAGCGMKDYSIITEVSRDPATPETL